MRLCWLGRSTRRVDQPGVFEPCVQTIEPMHRRALRMGRLFPQPELDRLDRWGAGGKGDSLCKTSGSIPSPVSVTTMWTFDSSIIAFKSMRLSCNTFESGLTEDSSAFCTKKHNNPLRRYTTGGVVELRKVYVLQSKLGARIPEP